MQPLIVGSGLVGQFWDPIVTELVNKMECIREHAWLGSGMIDLLSFEMEGSLSHGCNVIRILLEDGFFKVGGVHCNYVNTRVEGEVIGIKLVVVDRVASCGGIDQSGGEVNRGSMRRREKKLAKVNRIHEFFRVSF